MKRILKSNNVDHSHCQRRYCVLFSAFLPRQCRGKVIHSKRHLRNATILSQVLSWVISLSFPNVPRVFSAFNYFKHQSRFLPKSYEIVPWIPLRLQRNLMLLMTLFSTQQLHLQFPWKGKLEIKYPLHQDIVVLWQFSYLLDLTWRFISLKISNSASSRQVFRWVRCLPAEC